jgi:hypothetical protein
MSIASCTAVCSALPYSPYTHLVDGAGGNTLPASQSHIAYPSARQTATIAIWVMHYTAKQAKRQLGTSSYVNSSANVRSRVLVCPAVHILRSTASAYEGQETRDKNI